MAAALGVSVCVCVFECALKQIWLKHWKRSKLRAINET